MKLFTMFVFGPEDEVRATLKDARGASVTVRAYGGRAGRAWVGYVAPTVSEVAGEPGRFVGAVSAYVPTRRGIVSPSSLSAATALETLVGADPTKTEW